MSLAHCLEISFMSVFPLYNGEQRQWTDSRSSQCGQRLQLSPFIAAIRSWLIHHCPRIAFCRHHIKCQTLSKTSFLLPYFFEKPFCIYNISHYGVQTSNTVIIIFNPAVSTIIISVCPDIHNRTPDSMLSVARRKLNRNLEFRCPYSLLLTRWNTTQRKEP